MKTKQEERRKRFRAHSSISTIAADQDSVKLPPVSNRQRSQQEKSLSSYQLVDSSYSKHAYKGQKFNKISSKIDFFDSQNQRKLDVSRKNILKCVGAEPIEPKPRPMKMKRRHNLTPSLHILVNHFLRKKQQGQQKQGEYVVIGSKNKLLYC